MTTTRGIVQIHSAPSALCPHIEWAIGGVLGAPVHLSWAPQPAERGASRTELAWSGLAGASADIASAMKRWARVRFEVTEEASARCEASRYSYTPSLGVFHAQVGAHGDVLVPEERLRHALLTTAGDPGALRAAIDALLGTAWDAELEIFRQAGDGVPVRWLNRVG